MPNGEVRKICEKCKDVGYIPQKNGSVRKCECLVLKEKMAIVERLFKDSKIPKRYLDFNYDNLVLDKSFIEKIKTHDLKEKRNSLLLFGGYGSGKTTLATVYLKAKVNEGIAGIFISVPDLLDHIRSAYDEAQRLSPDEIIEQAKKVDLLVLDDLGAEKPSEWVKEKLFQIVNYRYNELLPTIFTSNLSPEELENKIGERIVARIMEMAKIIKLVGRNLREI